jgi:hypothetical protein
VFGRVRDDVVDLVSNDTRHRPFQNLAPHRNIQRLENGTQDVNEKAAVDPEEWQNTIADHDGIAE